MKIAIPWEANSVFQHFGQTKLFSIYEVVEGQAKEAGLLDAGQNGHGALVGLLKEESVDTVICGGIGNGARELLQAAGIKLVAGAQGRIQEVVTDYLAGTLQHNADFHCDHHDHGDSHSCGHTH